MANLYNDLKADIKYLKNSGIIYEPSDNIYINLLSSEKYNFKTRQTIKSIIEILDIQPDLKKFITPDLYKYFDDYVKSAYINEV